MVGRSVRTDETTPLYSAETRRQDDDTLGRRRSLPALDCLGLRVNAGPRPWRGMRWKLREICKKREYSSVLREAK